MDECVNDITYSIIETSLQNDGLTTIQQALACCRNKNMKDFLQAQIQQPGNSYLAIFTRMANNSK